jgi:hypothetical protein
VDFIPKTENWPAMSERSESNGCPKVTVFGNSRFLDFEGHGAEAAVNWLTGRV